MIKRSVDILAAAAGLLLLWPLLLLVALAVKLDSPGPVFFRQVRVGRGGRPFLIFKFRTMAHGRVRAGPEITVGEDARITRVGAFLRRTKIDELPQLIDVLRGTMSLVGPRPEVPRYVAYYPPAVRDKVLSVRPGITDWASLRYRDENALLAQAADPEREYLEVVLPSKLRHAVEYVETASLANDLKVLGLTLSAVFVPEFPSRQLHGFMNSPGVWARVDRWMGAAHARRMVLGTLVDAVLVAACWFAAYAFRLGFERFTPGRPWYDIALLGGVIVVYVLALQALGVRRAIWRFFGFGDVRRLAWACLVAGLVSAVAIQLAQLAAVSRAVLVLHPLFVLVALSTARLLYRSVYEHTRNVVDSGGEDGERREAIVLGATDAARRLIAGIHRREGWQVRCVLDDDPGRIGSRLAGIPVTGTLEHLLDPETLAGATHVIIALPQADDALRRRALALATDTGLPVLTVPSAGDLATAVPTGSAVQGGAG
jgi:lipopolysaccharide/colanic/teichoic acid biosynthesis glycosyltransferase